MKQYYMIHDYKNFYMLELHDKKFNTVEQLVEFHDSKPIMKIGECYCMIVLCIGE